MPKVKRKGVKRPAKAPYKGRGHQRVDKSPAGQESVAMEMVQALRSLFLRYTSAHPNCTTDALAMSKYMRNKFTFFGIKTPERRKIQREFVKAHKTELEDRRLLLELTPLLWDQEEREFQHFGCDVLKEFRERVLGSSEAECHEALACLERLITSKSWWDTVDAVSYPVVGYFVQQRPEYGVPLMHQWVDHDDMWLRRTAILHQISLRDKTDQQRLFKLCLARAHEDEFFIRKAIGWALREYSKTVGEAVRGFVEDNRDRLSALSIKEALKYC